jgi:hypothetical protein
MPNIFLVMGCMLAGYAVAFAGRWTWKPRGRDEMVLSTLGYAFGAGLAWIAVMPAVAAAGSLVLLGSLVLWRRRHPPVA